MRMAQSMATTKRTTKRKELLEIMRESYLFGSNKEARYALGAVCAAIRAWLIAMTRNAPKDRMTRLNIPGVGALRVAWYEYKSYSPKLVVRFTPHRTVRAKIQAHNKAEYAAYLQRSVPGTEEQVTRIKGRW